jgi:hypothetical protein
MRGHRAIAFAALILAGCGLRHTVDRSLLRNVPIEDRLALFDAENDFLIVEDERDRHVQRIRSLKRGIDDAKRLVQEAQSDGARARTKRDNAAAEVARLAEASYEYKVEYLEEALGYARARLKAHGLQVDGARARYELAKARVVEKNKLEGAEDVKLAEFESQAEEHAAATRTTEEALTARKAEVLEARNAWTAAQEKLRDASGGGLGNAWIDDDVVWGD